MTGVSKIILVLAMFFCAASLFGNDGKRQENAERIVRSLEEGRRFHGSRSPDDSRGGKCGLWQSFEIQRSWNDFTESQKQRIRNVFSTTGMEKERVIGHFRIYYDTSPDSIDTPALIDANDQRIPGTAEQFIDSVGRFFNEAWDFEINRLGYPAPPLRADALYPVIVRELGTGTYGRTLWFDSTLVDAGPPPRYRTFIEIDNDFLINYAPSRGIPGLKVTAAHEFHHAIQIGTYGYWSNDLYFYEITSTWMEDVVYNDVNDYYQYLFSEGSQFVHPEFGFTQTDLQIQYSRAIWGKFIEKRFGRDAMRHTWEYLHQVPTVPGLDPSIWAIDRALSDLGTSFRQEFLQWAYWNFNTGPTGTANRFYPEGQNYPKMRIQSRADFIPPSSSIQGNLETVSSSYYKVCILKTPADSCGINNEMDVIISNVNTPEAASTAQIPFTYTISSSQTDGARKLSNGLWSNLDVGDPENWSTQETVPSVIGDVLVFPLPYVVRSNKPLWFRLPEKPQSSTATLYVFGSDLDKIVSRELPVLDFRPLEPAIQWDGHTDSQLSITTGVYFYVIVVDEKQYTGKFAAIRE